MKIAVKQASILTATVEIKTLTVSGKQVTLAVFRQLEEEQAIDWDTLKLEGTVWGQVNYHSDKCGEEDPHVHIVWQSGEELRRCKIYKDFPYVSYPKWKRLYDSFYNAAKTCVICQVLEGEREINSYDTWSPITLNVNGRLVYVHLDDNVRHALEPLSEQTTEWGQRRNLQLLEGRRILRENRGLPALTVAKNDMLAKEHPLTVYEAEWAKLWDEINAAPQLFIAV